MKKATFKLNDAELISVSKSIGMHWEEFNSEFRADLSPESLVVGASAGGHKMKKISLFVNKQVTGEILTRIVERTPNLRELFIPGTPINDDSILALVDSCGKSLETLAIGVCHNLTSKTMLHLRDKIPNCTFLALIMNPWVDDDGMFAILPGVKKIKKLALNGTKITDKTLHEMGRLELQDLETIYTQNCDISEKGLIAAMRGCPLLVKFEIKGCEKITPSACERIRGIRSLIEIGGEEKH